MQKFDSFTMEENFTLDGYRLFQENGPTCLPQKKEELLQMDYST
jgi:hypothetical protein